MRKGKKRRQRQAGGDEPFGAGLGPDFYPLGRRLVVGPGQDQAKLKRRRTKPDDKSAPEAEAQPEE